MNLVEHVTVRRLRVHVHVEWEGLSLGAQPGVLVGEAPGDEAGAVWLGEADVEKISVVLRLKLLGRIVPAATIVVVVACDIDLGDLNIDADLRVSLHVSADARSTLVEAVGVVVVGGDVGLEADSVDRASPLFHIRDQIVHTVRLLLAPVVGVEDAVVVDEEFGLGIGLMGPVESLADEVLDDVEWLVLSD